MTYQPHAYDALLFGEITGTVVLLAIAAFLLTELLCKASDAYRGWWMQWQEAEHD